MRRTSDKREGFTVVELIIGIGIMSAIAIGIVSLIVSIVGNATRSIETTKQVHETQSALSTIKDDLRLTNSFLASSHEYDVNRDGNEWDYRGNGEDDRTFILLRRSTHLSSVAEDRLPLYRLTSNYDSDIGCISTSPNPWPEIWGDDLTSEPEYHTVIYYTYEGTLYRRVVTQPIPQYDLGAATYWGATCPGSSNTPLRTCADPSSSPAEDNCRQRDVVLAQNVTRFDIVYYNNSSDQEGYEEIFNNEVTQDDLTGLATVKITIQTSKDIGGRDNEFTSQIRANRGAL